MSYTLVSRIPVGRCDERLTVNWSPGRMGRLLGYKDRDLVFEGSGTVWYHYPTGRQASVRFEVLLDQLVTADDHASPGSREQAVSRSPRDPQLTAKGTMPDWWGIDEHGRKSKDYASASNAAEGLSLQAQIHALSGRLIELEQWAVDRDGEVLGSSCDDLEDQRKRMETR